MIIHGEITQDIAGEVIRAILEDSDQIELVVNSPGGDLDEVFAIHDLMLARCGAVATLALGRCMSAAVLLVAAGEPGARAAGDNTTFMLHDAELEVGACSPCNLRKVAEVTAANMVRYAHLLASYSRMPWEFWHKKFTHGDHYFTAEQALEWGLIDKII